MTKASRMLVSTAFLQLLEVQQYTEQSDFNDNDFSYKEISELSDATDDIRNFNESIDDSELGDLDDF